MKQGPEEKTVLQDVPWEDEPPVLEPGHDFDSVTDKITDAVLKRPIGLGWLAGLAAGMGLLGILLIAVTYLFLRGRRHLGHRDTGGLGLRDHQLRVVDRYRSRGNPDLGHPAAAEAIVAQLDQPLRGSHDAVRGGLRRYVPAAPHGPSVAGVLDVPVSQHDGGMATVPQPAGVGRVCGFDLRDDLGGVLVRGPGARFRHHARTGDPSGDQEDLRHPVAGLARFGAALEALRGLVHSAGRPGDAAGAVGTHGRQLRFCDRQSCRAGTRRSSRPTLWRAPSIPDSPWCWCWRFRSATSITWKT